jgi:hypothetical protein
MEHIHLAPEDDDDLYSGYDYSSIADVRTVGYKQGLKKSLV